MLLQVVVDAIDPSCLVSGCATRQFDFLEMQEEELYNIVIPLDLEVGEQNVAVRCCTPPLLCPFMHGQYVQPEAL